MADLSAKQARNEALRTELRALRTETEHINTTGHDALMEEKLDAEAAQLQREVEEARARRDAALEANGGNGSVEDATAAMRAAAGETSTEQSNTDAESTATEAPALMPTLLVAGEAEKDGEK